MTGVWINTDLMGFMRVPGAWAKGLGITYLQATFKSMELEEI